LCLSGRGKFLGKFRQWAGLNTPPNADTISHFRPLRGRTSEPHRKLISPFAWNMQGGSVAPLTRPSINAATSTSTRQISQRQESGSIRWRRRSGCWRSWRRRGSWWGRP